MKAVNKLRNQAMLVVGNGVGALRRVLLGCEEGSNNAASDSLDVATMSEDQIKAMLQPPALPAPDVAVVKPLLDPLGNTYTNVHCMLQALLDQCSSGGTKRLPKIHKVCCVVVVGVVSSPMGCSHARWLSNIRAHATFCRGKWKCARTAWESFG